MRTYEIIGGILWLLLLLLLSVSDIRRKSVPVLPVIIAGVTSVLCGVLFGEQEWYFYPCGLLPGMAALMTAKVTGEKIGYGDGMVLCSLGVFLGGLETLLLWCLGSFFAAIFTVFLFAVKKAGKKQLIPFLPFLSMGYILLLYGKLSAA